jgi:hypothetical protein
MRPPRSPFYAGRAKNLNARGRRRAAILMPILLALGAG